MAQKDPLEDFLDEVSKVMGFLNASKNKPIKEIPKEIIQWLEVLVKQGEILAKTSDIVMTDAGVTEEEKKRKGKEIKTLPVETRRLLTRAEQIELELAVAEGEAAAEMIIAKKREKDAKKGSQNAAKRKKKFRRLGGGDWKPL